jgi:hypothetical protein
MNVKALSFLAFLSFSTVCGLAADEQRPIDLVVALDTSSSMHGSYKAVTEYAVGPLLKEFLRLGDTFHLIGFSGVPRTELSRQIEGSGDIETIIGRVLLMYPLDPYTDFVSALEYVRAYLADLPESRSKIVVFISDGEHAPAPGSPYAGISPDALNAKIGDSTARLKGNGWTFYFVKVPFSGDSPLPSLSSPRPKSRASSASFSLGSGSSAGSGSASAAGKSSGGNGAAGAGASNATSGGVSAQGSASQTDAAVSGGTTGTGSAGQAAGSASNSGADNSAADPAVGPVDVSDAVAGALASPVIELGDGTDDPAIAAAVGSVIARFPESVGKKPREFAVRITVSNPSSSTLYLETSAVLVDGVDRMSRKSFVELPSRNEKKLNLNVALPDSYALGAHELTIEPLFTGAIRLAPSSAPVSVTLVKSPFTRFLGGAFPVVVFIAAVLGAFVLVLIAILSSRRYAGAPVRAAAAAAVPERDDKKRGASLPVSAEAVPGAPSAGAGVSTAPGSVRAAHSGSAAPAYSAPLGSASASAAGNAAADSDLLASFAKRTGEQERARDLAMRDSAQRERGDPTAASAHAAERERGARHGSDATLPSPELRVKRAQARSMLSLWVKDQNTNIGKRNVHLMKAGATLSLGGGHSDFLVFLVPLPHRIADLFFDGEKCSLVVRKPAYFPELTGGMLEDCVGKEITVVSDKGYVLTIRIDTFEDPLVKLNQFLHSIDVPGRSY